MGDGSDVIVLVAPGAERMLHAVSVAAWRDMQTEWGGLLFGENYQCRGRRVVWVAAAVPGIGRGTPVSFEMDPRSYVLGRRLLQPDECAPSLSEIGFWHSHPHIDVYPSRTDAEYHRLTFPNPLSLSIILDPFAPRAAVYANTESGLVQVRVHSFDSHGLLPTPRVAFVRPWIAEEVAHALR